MKVLKFGGTSVGTVESLTSVKKIVEGRRKPVIIVVSALGGVTDMLISTAKAAAAGEEDTYLETYAKIIKRHHDVIEGMVPDHLRSQTFNDVDRMLDELGNIFKGVSLLNDLSSRSLDTIVSYGERLSSLIISRIIKGARLFDSRQIIKTVDQFGKHVLDNDATLPLVMQTLGAKDYEVAVVPGFISSDSATGDVTNLGRGGSDYTAAIIAAALDADLLEIWTDVDGFMTADPRIISNTYVIDHLTFVEAMELCNFGAKVIYPPTIYPVFHKNIPILLKNTFNPDAKGTLISSSSDASEGNSDGKAIKGISSISDTCLITVSGLGMVGIVGINARIFNALAREGVSVFMVSQASSENTTSFAVKNEDAARAVEALEKEYAAELASGELNPIHSEHNLATVAIVGENMRNAAGVAGRLFNTLGRNGINVISCAQGASETNISFVIKIKDQKKALNVIHDSFFLSDTQVLNLFIIGIGNIGRHLLQQLALQQEKLLREKALKLKVVGIANSTKVYFDREGMNLDTCLDRLAAEGLQSSPELIRDEVIGMNIFNSVFVDCTSSPQIAALYPDMLSHNVNVVAANKIAASGCFDGYRELKAIARRRDVKYLFETNVGAGLPIINTINSLINSGDKIIRIEAVLSGTLNFIFNTISDTVPFSEAIRRAMAEGYSEPDPRVDLSGTDVMRKLVILARESGYQVSLPDVISTPLLHPAMFDGSVEDFLEAVKQLDDDFESRRGKATREGKRFRFVARLDNGSASVGLEMVGSDHPFYNLEGSNNVILLTTERYHDYPMVIKGYGAGSDVTAAGVFADIISIANIR
ncbi:bifunctional aspartate kinase/homoserine dehydrogenase I [Paramuribaculum intestinale]|uniref:bifunctional aspartate kinase/homoserine dehydrogenase I n=1 Tax=Paramuribaculum intestinale TaxID=2094151 RepID=UPI0025A9E7FE|nr:bifunctional aspartate kinase/homoserine dehydrogenase I [Paramuribaculum intestinale]